LLLLLLLLPPGGPPALTVFANPVEQGTLKPNIETQPF
jgi:hypothetical protein